MPDLKQRLVRVDIAHPDDHARIHQKLFDRDAATARGAMQKAPIEFRVQRFDPQVPNEPMLAPVAVVVVDASEPPWIRQPQHALAVELDVDVIVWSRRGYPRAATAGCRTCPDE